VETLAKLTQAFDALAHFRQFDLLVVHYPICPGVQEATKGFPNRHSVFAG
jgi:hypothetical protein